MNLVARLLSLAFPVLATASPASVAAAADLVTDPGAVAAIVSMSDAELKAKDIARIALGDVVLSTGHIVATDPLVQPERPAFLVTVPPGRYPVTLYEAEGRIAVAVMRFAQSQVFRWQLAVVEGQDVRTLKPDEYFGYGVDAGLGSYMDKATAALMTERQRLVEAEMAEKGTRYSNYYDDILAGELSANGDDYVIHRPMPDKAGNVAIFSSGWGDGFYPAYWGLDSEGRPVVLLTDFQVIQPTPAEGDGQ